MSAIDFGVQSGREVIDQPLHIQESQNPWERLAVKGALAKSYTPVDSIVRGVQHLYHEATGGPDLSMDELKAMNKDVKWDSPMNKERANLTIERHNNVKQANKYISDGESDESFLETAAGLGLTLTAHAIDPTYWMGGVAVERGLISAVSKYASAAKYGGAFIEASETGLALSTAGRALEGGIVNYATEAGIMGAMSKVENQEFEHSQARNAAIIGVIAPYALKSMGKTWQKFKNKNVYGRASDYVEQQVAKGNNADVSALEEVVDKGVNAVDEVKLRTEANHPTANSVDEAINNPKAPDAKTSISELEVNHSNNLKTLNKKLEVPEGAEGLDEVGAALSKEVSGDLAKAGVMEEAYEAAARIVKGGCE